jgi:hypothetical protein
MILNNGFELTVRARFPLAQAVYLLGEFNRWSTAATPMSYVGRGMWEARVRLESELKRLAYFVWQGGHSFGKITYQEEGLRAAADAESFIDAAHFDPLQVDRGARPEAAGN